MKTIVVYASMTGNTESLANEIGALLSGEVVIKRAADTNAEELNGYDMILLGSSTWGDGEMQDDMIAFVSSMEKDSLQGKKGAAFGTGEKSWPQYCHAVDILSETLTESGITPKEGLKIDVTEGDYSDVLNEWISTL